MRSEGFDDDSIRDFLRNTVNSIVTGINMMSKFRGNSNFLSFEDHKVIEKTDNTGWDILIRMELLSSLGSKQFWQTRTYFSEAETITLGIHICRALELCALQNIVHRDIKLDNLFITQYGEYKLGDFAIARRIEHVTSGLTAKGSYTYMAPEIIRGDPYGASADMYSLGIVMYQLLNQNRTPFHPDPSQPMKPGDHNKAMKKRLSGEPIPLLKGVSPELNAIIQKACAYNRNDRFANPTEMRLALEAAADAEINPGQPIAQTDTPAPAPETADSPPNSPHINTAEHMDVPASMQPTQPSQPSKTINLIPLIVILGLILIASLVLGVIFILDHILN
jgi:serine/threonine-protein kinase